MKTSKFIDKQTILYNFIFWPYIHDQNLKPIDVTLNHGGCHRQKYSNKLLFKSTNYDKETKIQLLWHPYACGSIFLWNIRHALKSYQYILVK